MKTTHYIYALLAIIGMSACDSSSLDYIPEEDTYFGEDTAGNENWDIDYDTEVQQRVSVSKTVTDYALNIEIWSEMPEILEGTTARYGIRQYLYCDKCKKYDDAADYTFNYMDEKTEHHIIENLIYDIDSDYAMYYRIYNTISDKIASGEQLYESQVKLYKKTKDKLSEIIDNFHFDIFIEIMGTKYPVKGYWSEDVEPRK